MSSLARRTFVEQTSSRSAPPEVLAAVEGIKSRIAWPSIHWGVEDVHPDAWPHIAAAALDAYLADKDQP